MRNRFSRTDRFGMIDSPTRSAQMRLTPCAIASRGDGDCHLAPIEQDLSAGHRPDAEQRAPDALLARAAKPDEADDLAGIDRAVDRADRLDHDRS